MPGIEQEVRHPRCLTSAHLEHPGINIRQSTSSDRHRLADFFCQLTQRSRANRFLSSIGSVTGSLLDAFVDADQISHMALLAVGHSDGHEVVIGEARVVSDPLRPATSEFAIAVADHWQGCGIGRLLLRSIEEAALRQGVLGMTADTFASNTPMTALASSLNYKVSRHPFDFKLCRLEKAIVGDGGGVVQGKSN